MPVAKGKANIWPLAPKELKLSSGFFCHRLLSSQEARNGNQKDRNAFSPYLPPAKSKTENLFQEVYP